VYFALVHQGLIKKMGKIFLSTMKKIEILENYENENFFFNFLVPLIMS
jgi:hypothetical protein